MIGVIAAVNQDGKPLQELELQSLQVCNIGIYFYNILIEINKFLF